MKTRNLFKFYLLLLVILALGLGLFACGDPEVVTSATAIATTGSTTTAAATVAPTNTVVATALPTVTPARATAIPPTATAVPATATPVPSTATATVPPTPVPATATPTSVQNPAGYPGKIAFDTKDNQIFIINPDGSGRKKVADGRSPLFSPDGTRVAFIARGKPSTDLEIGTVTISSVKLDGSDRQDYCEMSGNAQIDLVRWSPRNRFIVINGTQNGPGGLYLCNLAEHKLSSDALKYQQGSLSRVYDWTPDGENALWQASTDYQNFKLFYGDPDKAGDGAVEIAKNVYRSELGGYKFFPVARFSPDGNTIAIGGGGIYFVAAPGKKSPLDGDKGIGAYVHNLAWSPDGRALALIDQAPGLDPNPPYTLHIEAFGNNDYAGKTVEITENLGGGLDWTRQ
jgi:hypothetical protein